VLIISANRQTLLKKNPESDKTHRQSATPLESPKRAPIDCFAKNKPKSATEKFLLKVKQVKEMFLFLRFQNH
jgi:hypothetical protein